MRWIVVLNFLEVLGYGYINAIIGETEKKVGARGKI